MLNADLDLELVSGLLAPAAGPDPLVRKHARATLLHVIDAEQAPDRPAAVTTATAAGDATEARRRGWLRRLGARQFALIGITLGVGATAATAGSILGAFDFGHDTPRQLFRANPLRIGGEGWAQQAVVPGTTRLVETVDIPTFGPTQFWAADSRPHGICLALRMPDGTWSGRYDKRYPLGGPIPGCMPVNTPNVNNGFVWFEGQGAGRWTGRIAYGIVPRVGTPVRVRDSYSGNTTRVIAGRWFAIVIPPASGRRIGGDARHPLRQLIYRLETLDASGRVLVRAPRTIEP
jgi:hypothetical protein